MENITFRFPQSNDKIRALEYISEFKSYNSEINGVGGLDRCNHYSDWIEIINQDLDLNKISSGRVPATTYFAVREEDKKIIGMVNIRHTLNEFLRREGGHIGYSVRPVERNKGYGKIILNMALGECKKLGINTVILGCKKLNTASRKVIINNGGILEAEFYSEVFKTEVQRYYIRLE